MGTTKYMLKIPILQPLGPPSCRKYLFFSRPCSPQKANLFFSNAVLCFLKKDLIEVEDYNLKIKVPTVAGCGELMLYKFFRTQIFQWLS